MARWLEQLQEFSFRTEYHPSEQHSNADALSRKPCFPNDHANGECQPRICIVSQGSESWAAMWSSSELLQKQRVEPVIGVILSWKEKGSERPPETAVATGGRTLRSLWVQRDRLELMDGLLYWWWEESTGTRKRQLLIP